MPVLNDVQRAYDVLTAKSVAYTMLWRYFDGDAPVRYVSDRLKDFFKSATARFTLNWSEVVISAEHERLHLRQFTSADTTAQERLNALFQETELNLDAPDVHLSALVTGEAFVFGWKSPTGEIEAYYNDSRLCHIFYDEENPRKKSFAAKWWIGGDGYRYLNLYYADRIDYYVSDSKSGDVSSAEAFKPVEALPSAPNPFGVIPIFHFRTERRTTKSRLQNVIEPQDAVNKLFTDMMVVAEVGAFRQRWIVTSANIASIKSAPYENWKIPAGDGTGESTQVGEFDVTDLGNYLNAMDSLASKIAVITRTPKHHFFSQGGDPSGEALIAMEAPLNKKATGAISHFKPTWAEVGAFMLELDGMTVSKSDITPDFERPETVQPRTTAEIREINTRAGMSLRSSLRREGWTDAELDQLDAEPLDKVSAAKLAAEILKDRVPLSVLLEVFAPAFGWDEAQITKIADEAAAAADEQARRESRAVTEALLGVSNDETP